MMKGKEECSSKFVLIPVSITVENAPNEPFFFGRVSAGFSPTTKTLQCHNAPSKELLSKVPFALSEREIIEL